MKTKLILTQDAYLTGTFDDPYYTAVARPAELTQEQYDEMDLDEKMENQYDIIWYPIDPENLSDDESNNCYWSFPDEIYVNCVEKSLDDYELADGNPDYKWKWY